MKFKVDLIVIFLVTKDVEHLSISQPFVFLFLRTLFRSVPHFLFGLFVFLVSSFLVIYVFNILVT